MHIHGSFFTPVKWFWFWMLLHHIVNVDLRDMLVREFRDMSSVFITSVVGRTIFRSVLCFRQFIWQSRVFYLQSYLQTYRFGRMLCWMRLSGTDCGSESGGAFPQTTVSHLTPQVKPRGKDVWTGLTPRTSFMKNIQMDGMGIFCFSGSMGKTDEKKSKFNVLMVLFTTHFGALTDS